MAPKKLKHISGEWMIAQNQIEDKVQYTVLANGSKVICDVYRHNFPAKKGAKEPLSEANAKLIAQAPELLKSLNDAVTELNFIINKGLLKSTVADVPYFKNKVVEYEAVIKKATL